MTDNREYPEQDEIRKSLNRFVKAFKNRKEAAAALKCNYRMLAHWQYGTRWIPDEIALQVGATPVPRLVKPKPHNPNHGGPRTGVPRWIVSAAVSFVEAVRANSDVQNIAARELFAAVDAFHGKPKAREMMRG